MKRLIAAVAFAAAFSCAPGEGQTILPRVVSSCSTSQGYTPGLHNEVTVDTNGNLCTSGGGGSSVPYGYTPLATGQHNVALTSATSLTVPNGATYAVVQAASANVKYTTDGVTTPTSTIGMTLSAGSSLSLTGASTIANFKAIAASAGATLDVEYFK